MKLLFLIWWKIIMTSRVVGNYNSYLIKEVNFYRLGLYENGILRKVVGAQKEEVTRNW